MELFNQEKEINKYQRRREAVFILLAGLFLGSLAMLNILGISRFLDLSFVVFGVEIPFKIAIGVLPYPITFLCTDFISELYGRRRANQVVWTGLILNIWVILVLWIGGELPPIPDMEPSTGLPDPSHNDYAFYYMRRLTFGATVASMIAYLTAQFIDVHIFHFIKKKTRGRHLWLRNNGSTLFSQLVDSVAVILITHYYASALDLDPELSILQNLLIYIFSAYIFKMVAALLDTIPFIFGTRALAKYLDIDPLHEYAESSTGTDTN